MITSYQKNIATFIHLSTVLGFLFPFGNFIGPLILWMFNKDKSEFVDAHGKQALNFQISVLIYAILIAIIAIPILIIGVFAQTGAVDFEAYNDFNFNFYTLSPLLLLAAGLFFILVIGFIVEVILIIIASLKARDGELYKYPLTINFLK